MIIHMYFPKDRVLAIHILIHSQNQYNVMDSIVYLLQYKFIISIHVNNQLEWEKNEHLSNVFLFIQPLFNQESQLRTNDYLESLNATAVHGAEIKSSSFNLLFLRLQLLYHWESNIKPNRLLKQTNSFRLGYTILYLYFFLHKQVDLIIYLACLFFFINMTFPPMHILNR